MIIIALAAIGFIIYKFLFAKPSYRYWLRLIEGNEEKEIPLTRIDEVNFMSVNGNIRVYKDPTVHFVRNGKKQILYGWGISPYYIAKDPQSLLNMGVRELIIQTGSKEIRFDNTWRSLIDYYAYLIKYKIATQRVLSLDNDTKLVIAVDYPSFIKSTIEDTIHTNAKHSLRQLEEIINIEKKITAQKGDEMSWFKWVIVLIIVLGAFAVIGTVLHH